MDHTRRRLIGWVLLAAALSGGIGLAAPWVWLLVDPRPAVADSLVGELGSAGLFSLGTDPWGRALRGGRANVGSGTHEPGAYWSTGPNGVDEEGGGDDVPVLPLDDPRVVPGRLARLLCPLVPLGIGAGLLLVLQRRALAAQARLLLPALGAASAAAIGVPLIRAFKRFAPESLPPYPRRVLVATAIVGGLIMGWAMIPQRDPDDGPPA